MIRRFKDWQSDDDSRWQSSMWNYENYINEKKASILQALFDFIDRFTLHDGRITHIQEVGGVPTKKDALLTILSPKNGWMCDCDSILVVMHLVGVRGAIKTTLPAIGHHVL